MNYIVFYEKPGIDNNMSFFYTFGLQQVLDFYNMFSNDLECLYVMLYNKQETHLTMMYRNKCLLSDNLTVKDLKALFRAEYKLDDDYILY